jgi:DNA-binding transcriptional LysR family regulator
MVPTPRAEDLAAPVRTALAEIEKAFVGGSQFDPATAERTFTFMGADYFSMRLMPDLARRISAGAPGIVLRLLDSARGDVDRLLQEDLIDAALERPLQVPEWISSELLFTSPFVIIAATGNPKLGGVAPGEAIPLDLFCAMPQAIRSIDGSLNGFVDSALAGVDRRRRVVLALPHFHGIALAVAGSGLLAAVPQQVAAILPRDLGLTVYQLPVAVPEPEVRMYWHSRHDDESGHRWIRAEIQAALQPVQAGSGA